MVMNYVTITQDGINGSLDIGGCMPISFIIRPVYYDSILQSIEKKERCIKVETGNKNYFWSLPAQTYADIVSAIAKSREMKEKNQIEPVMKPIKYPSPKKER